MKNQCQKKGIVFAAAAIGAILLAGVDIASAKIGKVELNLTGTPVQNRRPQALEGIRKRCRENSISEKAVLEAAEHARENVQQRKKRKTRPADRAR